MFLHISITLFSLTLGANTKYNKNTIAQESFEYTILSQLLLEKTLMEKQPHKNNNQPQHSKNHEISNQEDDNNKTIINTSKASSLKSTKGNDNGSGDINSDLLNTVIKGRYRIESRIGHGGMCDVYRATDLLLEAAGASSPFVAIKALQNEFFNQPEAAKVLINEAQTTQKLSHPNIIRVYDFGIDKKICYLVMEYLDGETLDVVIQRSRPHGLPYKRAIPLLDQMLSALKYAHQNGIVHADLKPSNIMLTRDGEIKIFDFGVAKKLGENNDQYAAVQEETLSELGGYTPNYASINLLEGNDPEIKDDIFAFSCISYELCSSKHPFNRKPADVAQKEKIQPIKPKHLNSSKWRIIQQGLSLSAKERIGDAALISSQLHRQYKSTAIMITAILSLNSVVGYVLYQQKEAILELTTDNRNLHQHIEERAKLANLSAREIIKQLPELSINAPIIASGLLKSKQRDVIALYEHNIDLIFNTRENYYPNYYAIEAELAEVSKLYPDSHAINVLSTDISTSWQSTIDILSNQLNTALEKAHYQISADSNIYELLTNLKNLRHDIQFKPTSLAEKTYATQYKKAANQQDTETLATLIQVGETFFSTTDEHIAQLQHTKILHKATLQLEQFKAAREGDKPAPFPYESAELLYANKFDKFNHQLKRVNSESKLDKLLKQVDEIAKELPADFSSLITLRLASANQYLDFSEKWQKKRKQSAARNAMKKATHQFNLVEKAHSRS
ncbi:hypothetical serine/threonine protein kinase [Photobacterium profundum SS9]|uniref:Hypothetical serine/threonine protein kinase n=2 Tax=Photobacterium profundum TaxID=74109 RepID=Q6LUE7_PHOPR|nr:hypothetical serine/threonine protein kinase [Photobacterium profundum SS9]